MAINIQYDTAKGHFVVAGTISPAEFGALKDREGTIAFGDNDVELKGKKRSFYQRTSMRAVKVPGLAISGEDGELLNTMNLKLQCTLTATGFAPEPTPESVAARKLQQTTTRLANAAKNLPEADRKRSGLKIAFPDASEEEIDNMLADLPE